MDANRPSAEFDRLDRRQALLLAAATAGAFLLRLYRASARGVWLDEVEFLFSCLTGMSNAQAAPLPILIHRGFLKMVGSMSPFAFRFPSLVFGALLIPAVFFLGRSLGGSRAGWLAAFLAAVWPANLYYAQEARPYALFELASALTLVAFIRVYVRRSSRWLPLLLAVLLLCSTHMLAIHVITGLWLFVVIDGAFHWRMRSDHRALRIAALMAVIAIPALIWALRSPVSFRQILNGRYIHSFGFYLASLLSYLGPFFHHEPTEPFYLAIGVTIAAVALVGNFSLPQRPGVSVRVLAPVFFGVTFVAHYFTLGPKADWVWGRYLLHLLPLYLVLIAVALDRWLAGLPGRVWPWVAAALIAAPGFNHWRRDETYDRSAGMSQAAQSVAPVAAALKGVIIVSRPFMMGFGVPSVWWSLYRRDSLPVYVVMDKLLIATHSIPAYGQRPFLVCTMDANRMPVNGVSFINPGSYVMVPTEQEEVGCLALAPFADLSCQENEELSRRWGVRIVNLDRVARKSP